jgi:lipopolysaccharide export system permease protein
MVACLCPRLKCTDMLIFRTLCRPLYGHTLLFATGLCAAVWLSQSLRFLDFSLNRGVPASVLVTLVTLMLPGFLSVILPISYALAVLVVYRRAAGDQALVAWQSAGSSPWQLSRPAVFVGGVMTLLGLLATVFIMPQSYTAFKNLQGSLRENYASVLLQEGQFMPITDTLTLYIGERRSDGRLRDLLVHDTQNPDRPVTVLAKEGRMLLAAGKPVLEALNGSRQEMEKTTGRLGILYFDSYYVDLSSLLPAPSQRKKELQEYSIRALWQHPNQMYRTAGVGRLLAPFACFFLLVPALWATLYQPYRRQAAKWPLLIAILFVIAVQAFCTTVQNAGLSPVGAFIGLLALFLSLASLTNPIKFPKGWRQQR